MRETQAYYNLQFLIFHIMETTRKLFDDWAARVSSFLQPFGKPVRVFTSSVTLDYRPKVLYVGYNSHPDRAYPDMDINECLHSSPLTLYLKRYEKAQKDNIPLPKPDKDDARALINLAFHTADYRIPCYRENHVMMNAVYFCTDNIRQMRDSDPDGERKIKPCVDFTVEAITNIFRPRCVVTFSIQCFDLFKDRLTDMATIIPDRLERSERYDIQNIRKAFLDDIPVYGIPHPEWKSLKDKDFHAIVGYLKAEMISLGID